MAVTEIYLFEIKQTIRKQFVTLSYTLEIKVLYHLNYIVSTRLASYICQIKK
jgi:hypothetical protein